jgi:hypothetical protein
MYLTPDGLDHIPQECYLSPAGLAELPPGKYPLETGILADIPAGSKWDPAAYALVPETETA